jgi:hypothetical protein
MTNESYHTEKAKYTGDWRQWPSWLLDQWWNDRVQGRKRDRYGYGKRTGT